MEIITGINDIKIKEKNSYSQVQSINRGLNRFLYWRLNTTVPDYNQKQELEKKILSCDSLNRKIKLS